MITFQRVSKTAPDPHVGREFLLKEVSALLPSDRRVAVYGHSHRTLSTFLRLIVGSQVPDWGRIVRRNVRFSPILNAEGHAGGLLVMSMTAIDNIRYFARMHDVDAGHLIRLVELSCHLGKAFGFPVESFDWATRRVLEVAIISALPYDCYIVDRMDEIPSDAQWMLYHVANGREAGLIFTTSHPVTGANFGELGAMISRGGKLRVFEDVASAIHRYQEEVA